MRYFFISLFMIMELTAQDIILQFNKKGDFKIVQFTDTHWDNKSDNCEETLSVMRSVLREEKPNFVVYTGDIVTEEPVKEGWLSVIKPVVEAKIPWTVAFGNHDGELCMKKEEIYRMLKQQPYFIGEEGEVSGIGNFELPIYSSEDSQEVLALIYIFDSHDYTHNQKLGKYDWIKFNQIDWYRNRSDFYTRQNQGIPIPSIAFFHIPLPEYKDIAEHKFTVGDRFEGVASPEVNSGLFSSMVEKKDIVGVFSGHDHNNNYIGINKNIALGFGQVTGLDAYGRLDRGARVIQLEEGKSTFETWIRTIKGKKYHFYYPSGLTEINNKTEFLPALKVNPTKNGISYKYYEYQGKLKTVNDISSLQLKEEGTSLDISIELAHIPNHFAFIFEGWIKIPYQGLYKFYTYSDDGSKLFIDDKEIVNNDGGHAAKREEGIIGLEAGFHKIKVLYFEDYMGEELEVGFESILIPETKLPTNLLYIK